MKKIVPSDVQVTPRPGTFRTAAFLFLFALLLSLPAPGFAENRLKVVASIAPLADFARQIGGDMVDVTLLLPPGASPHTFEPAPKTVQEISRAKLFIRIGAGLEFWADRLITSRKGITVVTCSEGIELLRASGDHDHSTADPHIWLDPVLAIRIAERISEAFSAADPANSGFYKKNYALYSGQLKKLDREIAEKVSTFRTKEFITFHSAWNYFAKRYGLRVAGVIEDAPGKEPTPKHMAGIVKAVKGLRARVVFAEPQFNTRTAEAVAKEAGARVFILDPEGGQRGRETYLALMRYNLSVMEEALK